MSSLNLGTLVAVVGELRVFCGTVVVDELVVVDDGMVLVLGIVRRGMVVVVDELVVVDEGMVLVLGIVRRGMVDVDDVVEELVVVEDVGTVDVDVVVDELVVVDDAGTVDVDVVVDELVVVDDVGPLVVVDELVVVDDVGPLVVVDELVVVDVVVDELVVVEDVGPVVVVDELVVVDDVGTVDVDVVVEELVVVDVIDDVWPLPRPRPRPRPPRSTTSMDTGSTVVVVWVGAFRSTLPPAGLTSAGAAGFLFSQATNSVVKRRPERSSLRIELPSTDRGWDAHDVGRSTTLERRSRNPLELIRRIRRHRRTFPA